MSWMDGKCRYRPETCSHSIVQARVGHHPAGSNEDRHRHTARGVLFSLFQTPNGFETGSQTATLALPSLTHSSPHRPTLPAWLSLKSLSIHSPSSSSFNTPKPSHQNGPRQEVQVGQELRVDQLASPARRQVGQGASVISKPEKSKYKAWRFGVVFR
jgi:hypothetical protein